MITLFLNLVLPELGRRIDAFVTKKGKVTKIVEFKSVKGIPPPKFDVQYGKDLANDRVLSLDQICWVFDGSKVASIAELKTLLMPAIRRAVNSDLLTLERIAKLLGKDIDDRNVSKDALIEKIKDNFGNYFKTVK